MSKQEELSRCDTSFLRLLGSELNNSWKDYSKMEKVELLEILANKLSGEQINEIVRLYLLCLDANKVAERVKRDGVHEIYESIKKHLAHYSEILYEVPIGSRICDIVLFSDNSIIAIEVKSANDKIVRAVAQTTQYLEWANAVYLAYDAKHCNEARNLHELSQDIGLMEYKNGEIIDVRKSTHKSICNINRLKLMTHRSLRNIAVRFKIALYGPKKEVAEKLAKRLSEKQVASLFKEYLRSRSAYLEKATKLSAENEQTCPLAQFSEEL